MSAVIYALALLLSYKPVGAFSTSSVSSFTSHHQHHPSNGVLQQTHHRHHTTKLHLSPEIFDLSLLPPSTSFLVSPEEVESWRQYVPLIVSVGVIIDILLGSPIANLALGPMRRASEKGATDGPTQNEGGDSSVGSLFSNALNFDSSAGGGGGGGGVDSSRGKERVDSSAIAQAAIDKAMNTLELKQFLEENKTDEQRYEEVRRKIDKQMNDLED